MLPNLLHNYNEHLMKKIPMFTVLQLQGTVQRHTRVPDQQIKKHACSIWISLSFLEILRRVKIMLISHKNENRIQGHFLLKDSCKRA